MRNRLIIISCGVAIVIGILTYSGVSVYRGSALIDKSKEIITRINGNEFGELKSKCFEKISDDLEVVVLEDNKYSYKVDASTGEIANFGVKHMLDYQKINSPSKLTKEEAISKSKSFLDKYSNDKTQKMELAEYVQKLDENTDVHTFTYQGVASNGTKTGEVVYMWINQNGDLILYTRQKGNSTIAESSKPKISAEEAANNAWQYVIRNVQLEANMPIPKYDTLLAVYKDKLAYTVNFVDAVDRGFYKQSFYLAVDAQTGEVLYYDYSK